MCRVKSQFCLPSSWKLLTFVEISMTLYACEIAVTCTTGYYFYSKDTLLWFALTLGFLVVPLIGTQLLSFQLLNSSSITSNAPQDTPISHVIIHVFLCGVPWRYVRLARSGMTSLTKRDVQSMHTIRLSHTFSSTLPLLLLNGCCWVQNGFTVWPTGVSIIVYVVSSSLTIASYQKHEDYCCVIGALAPVTHVVCKMLWRSGELMSRVLSLSLFTSCHGYWLLLVLGLHELTMVLLLLMDHALTNADQWRSLISPWRLAVVAHCFLFCHVDPASRNSRNEFALYHVIVLMETVTLVLLWAVYDADLENHLILILTVTGTYIFGAVAGVLYYSCFYRKTSPPVAPSDNVVCRFQCVPCKFKAQRRRTHLQPPHHVASVQIQDNPNPQYFDVLNPSTISERKSSVDTASNHNAPIVVRYDSITVPSLETSSTLPDVSTEMDWDNYDFDVAAALDSVCGFELDMANPLEVKTGHLDTGYHSSNSSNRETQQVAGDILALGVYGLAPISDDSASMVSSISSRVENSERSAMSIECSSVYSSSIFSSSTFASSSQFWGSRPPTASAFRPPARKVRRKRKIPAVQYERHRKHSKLTSTIRGTCEKVSNAL
ncbi:hypothetical protein CAPTEDRAFT_211626 [Capitella teleta]|uniref:XK-related protein n=1 Tax=Capitella teleta TaxID=283909 RepID=R7UG75_CAPTE|nr:hypothetical protein CAPTEDRAFT_211626 [Capitella teleta]|eukprot:ELU05215.1 hypothetical protein CAPTEDRAFT_211626 [Capitella teleta]